MVKASNTGRANGATECSGLTEIATNTRRWSQTRKRVRSFTNATSLCRNIVGTALRRIGSASDAPANELVKPTRETENRSRRTRWLAAYAQGVSQYPAEGGGLSQLGRTSPQRRDGGERFRDGKRLLGFDLLGFWQWSASDVVSNATRGILAEYLVATAVGAALGVRTEWAAYDLKTPDGTRIEVKSAAYVQTWHQERPSDISFRYPKTLGWDPDTKREDDTPCRHADVYVFALLANPDQSTLDPLDVSQWEFFVVPTAVLDARVRSQHSITLPSLRKLVTAVRYSDLEKAVAGASAKQKDVVEGPAGTG